MLYIVLLLVLTALGLVVAALVTASSLWAWVSLGASGLAGILLIADRIRRRLRESARSAAPSKPSTDSTDLPTDPAESTCSTRATETAELPEPAVAANAGTGAVSSASADVAADRPDADTSRGGGDLRNDDGVVGAETVGKADAMKPETGAETVVDVSATAASSVPTADDVGDSDDDSGEGTASSPPLLAVAGGEENPGESSDGHDDRGPLPPPQGAEVEPGGEPIVPGSTRIPDGAEVAVAAREPVGATVGALVGSGPRTALLASSGELTGADVDPPEEDTDPETALVVSSLDTEVLVVDEYPRYHLLDCGWLGERATIPLAVKEARDLGFTPCALCGPDAALTVALRRKRLSRR